eukprot:00989_6
MVTRRLEPSIWSCMDWMARPASSLVEKHTKPKPLLRLFSSSITAARTMVPKRLNSCCRRVVSMLSSRFLTMLESLYLRFSRLRSSYLERRRDERSALDCARAQMFLEPSSFPSMFSMALRADSLAKLTKPNPRETPDSFFMTTPLVTSPYLKASLSCSSVTASSRNLTTLVNLISLGFLRGINFVTTTFMPLISMPLTVSMTFWASWSFSYWTPKPREFCDSSRWIMQERILPKVENVSSAFSSMVRSRFLIKTLPWPDLRTAGSRDHMSRQTWPRIGVLRVSNTRWASCEVKLTPYRREARVMLSRQTRVEVTKAAELKVYRSVSLTSGFRLPTRDGTKYGVAMTRRVFFNR